MDQNEKTTGIEAPPRSVDSATDEEGENSPYDDGVDTLGLGVDEEANLGGAVPDSTSVAMSGITMPSLPTVDCGAASEGGGISNNFDTSARQQGTNTTAGTPLNSGGNNSGGGDEQPSSPAAAKSGAAPGAAVGTTDTLSSHCCMPNSITSVDQVNFGAPSNNNTNDASLDILNGGADHAGSTGTADQAHIESTGQMSRPGAYRVEGPNIAGNDATLFDARPIGDHEVHSIQEDPHDLPELVATRVDPIEATIIPLCEAICIDDDNAGGGSDVDDDDDTNENGEMRSLNNSANGRNRTRLLEEPMKAADSGISSSLSHQLHLSNMKLHGREADMTLLSEKLFGLKRGAEEGNSTDALPELILISGVSGTGKSTLVMRGVRDPAEEMGMTFVGGKFDLNNSSMPLSAFVDAMASLTNYVIEWDQGHKIQYDLKEALREEDIMLLVRALPGSEGLFPQQREEIYRKRASQPSTDKVAIATQQYETLSLIGKRGIARLHHKIRRLLGIICTHLQGVVLFIDDLQWSDTATIDLLRSISLDSDIPSLLMIGAYREDEVSDTHPLASQINKREQMGTVIKIGNLTLENTTSLVVEALGMEADEVVEKLAFIIQKKTEGNVFFVLMFLRSLYDEKLLQYNCAGMKWAWNNDEVNAKVVTTNVATILITKLNRLGESQKSVLKIAACLGGRFAKSVLAMVISSLSERDAELDWHETLLSLDEFVDEFEREGILWEKGTENAWCFSHDKIQQAALELIPLEERDAFRGEIGNILLNRLDPEALEANLFEVVSLHNFAAATLSNSNERKESARMNLRAGMKASENAAFDSAVTFFKAGRESLGPDGWGTDPTAMIKLCSKGANACFVFGDLDTMHELINEVLSQDIPVVEKFNVCEIKIQAAHVAREFDEAISIAFDFRRQLGLPSLKNKAVNPFIIVKEFIKLMRALGNRTAEDIASLPELTDDRIIMGQRMLELLSTSSLQVQPTMFPLIVFLMVRATLKHGINASSCDAFQSLAMLCGPFRKPQEGREMSKAVDLILAKPGMDRMKSRSIFVYEGVIHHWTAPLQDTLEPFLEGYQSGLRTGDIESAGVSLNWRINHLYYAGRPLEGLKHEIQTSINALKQLNQTQSHLSAERMMLLVKILMGVRNGLDFEDITKDATESEDKIYRAKTFTIVLELKVFFQQWDVATNLLAEAGDLRPALRGLFLWSRFTFLEGLISIQSAQAAAIPWLKKRKRKKKAVKSMKIIREQVKKGNVNLVHCLHLLEAEMAALENKCSKAEDSYKAAITVASTNGFVQDCALSHELTSAHFASKGDHYWKDYHMDHAIRCYSEWGATAKVSQLTQ